VIFRECKIFWRSAASEQISSTPPPLERMSVKLVTPME
jgi:hypothetical protein